jgi:uncharacterized membrane protein SirB2
MKLPVEGMMSTFITGLVLTIIFGFIAASVTGGWLIDIILVLVLWGILFALMVKPTPPRT